jgi:hypothetical protein
MRRAGLASGYATLKYLGRILEGPRSQSLVVRRQVFRKNCVNFVCDTKQKGRKSLRPFQFRRCRFRGKF